MRIGATFGINLQSLQDKAAERGIHRWTGKLSLESQHFRKHLTLKTSETPEKHPDSLLALTALSHFPFILLLMDF